MATKKVQWYSPLNNLVHPETEASIVLVNDSGGYYTGINVEAILAEIYTTKAPWNGISVAVDKGGTGQTSYTNGQLLIGNTTGNTLTKATLTQGSGITITNGAGSISIANSAPDQTVVLTGGGTVSISGTYPNFTITGSAHPATNLGQGTLTATTIPLTSSTGTGTTLPSATTSLAGLMSAADKTKLDGIASGAQVNVPTDLSVGTVTATNVPINSSTGSNISTLPAATDLLAGIITANSQTLGGLKTFKDGLATGLAGQTWVIDGSTTSLLFQSGSTPTTRMTLTDGGVVTATTFVGALTGTASGNLIKSTYPGDWTDAIGSMTYYAGYGWKTMAIGSSGTVLKSTGTIPAWTALTTADISGAKQIVTNKSTSTITATTATTTDITSVVLTNGKTYKLSFLVQLGRNSYGSSKAMNVRVYCSSTSETIAGKMWYNASESASYDTPVLVNNAGTTNYGTTGVTAGTGSLSQIWVKGELFVAGTGQTVKLQLITTGTFISGDAAYCYRAEIAAIEV